MIHVYIYLRHISWNRGENYSTIIVIVPEFYDGGRGRNRAIIAPNKSVKQSHKNIRNDEYNRTNSVTFRDRFVN